MGFFSSDDFDSRCYKRCLQNAEPFVMKITPLQAVKFATQCLLTCPKEVFILSQQMDGLFFDADMLVDALKEAYKERPDLKCVSLMRRSVPASISFFMPALLNGAHLIPNVVDSSAPHMVFLVDGKHGVECEDGFKNCVAHANDVLWGQKCLKSLQELAYKYRTQENINALPVAKQGRGYFSYPPAKENERS